MNCIGHIFDQRPISIEMELRCEGGSHFACAGYTVPPRGSRLVSQIEGRTFALDPEGFVWACVAGMTAWCPTGEMCDCPSIESQRNFRMVPQEENT